MRRCEWTGGSAKGRCAEDASAFIFPHNLPSEGQYACPTHLIKFIAQESHCEVMWTHTEEYVALMTEKRVSRSAHPSSGKGLPWL